MYHCKKANEGKNALIIYPLTKEKIKDKFYSYLRASIGFNNEALYAG